MEDKKENPQLLPFQKTKNPETTVDDDVAEVSEVDARLTSLLNEWKTPQPSATLDNRVMSSYRDQTTRIKPSRRVFAGAIRIPVPIAAVFALLFFGLLYLAFRTPRNIVVERFKPVVEVQTRTIEIPVIKDHIVTRTVYVDRRSSSRRNSATNTSATRVNLDGYQPVDELKIRMLSNDQ